MRIRLTPIFITFCIIACSHGDPKKPVTPTCPQHYVFTSVTGGTCIHELDCTGGIAALDPNGAVIGCLKPWVTTRQVWKP